MRNPCETCLEYDLCQGTELPCQKRDAYAKYKGKCKEIRKHIKEVTEREKNSGDRNRR